MRASLIVASHNEGKALGKTLESCIASCGNLDYEIVVADDASTDGSAEDIQRRFPQVRVYRQKRRQGASPTKAMGARQARGEVLVFLDGHCLPEGKALMRLVEDVERLGGEAVTPQIAALDVKSWRNNREQVGNGYRLDLLTFECGWESLDQMRAVQEAGRQFYESAALIGCAFAVGRELYEHLWGFDPQMRYWGVEDVDFGLKCWLMGHRILHDPGAVVGHQFQSRFEKYTVPVEHVVVNELRAARKHFTSTVWEEWVDRRRERTPAPLPEHPEGLWARAWSLFEAGRPSVEQERWYLHGQRTRDEFWYAQRFRLSWPRLQPAMRMPTRAAIVHASPSPSPAPTCSVTAVFPNAPVLFVGEPKEFVAQGSNVSGVQWSTNPPGNPPTGSGRTFITRWNTTGNMTVTASCGGTSKTVPVKVLTIEVQINNTVPTNDDLVALKCDHPARRFNVPCRARLLGPAASPVNVVLTNPDGRLRFPNAGDATVNLTLPANNSFSAFQISGENASVALGDAVIQVRKDTATGDLIREKKVTVFSFDQAQMLLTQGGNYGFVGITYTVPGDVAVNFASKARIRPAGVDCSTAQVTNLRSAIMQESSNFRITITWDTPTIAWLASAAPGTTVTVGTTMRQTTTYAAAVAQPVNDGLAGASPLYSKSAAALQPPIGCAGSGTATSSDTPGQDAPTTFSLPVQVGGVQVGTVTWTHRINTTRLEHFRTFCVMFNQVTQNFCSLREAIWDLNADSGAANQHVTVNADGPATADPATGVQANNAANTTVNNPVGAATTTFTK